MNLEENLQRNLSQGSFLVKYRVGCNQPKKCNVENMTANEFLRSISLDPQRYRCSYRGRTIDGNDLIRNNVNSNQIFDVLEMNAQHTICDSLHAEAQYQSQSHPQVTWEDVADSQVQNHHRSGLIYTFRVFTTATVQSLLNGKKMQFSLNDNYSNVYQRIKVHICQILKKNKSINNGALKIFIFLPGGVPFRSGKLFDFYNFEDYLGVTNDYLYVVVTTHEIGNVDEIVHEPFNTSLKSILSPFCESTDESLLQIAGFLGYIKHGGPSEHTLLILGKLTRFAPLVLSFYKLMMNNGSPITKLDILSITSPLFTFFKSILPSDVDPTKVFEYTLKLLSVFELLDTDEYFEFRSFPPDEISSIRYFQPQQQSNSTEIITLWAADLQNNTFSRKKISQSITSDLIDNIFDTVHTFRPISPSSFHYIFHPSFCYGNNRKLQLFLHETGQGPLCINSSGERLYEKISENLNQADLANVIDPYIINQVTIICRDVSSSMQLPLKQILTDNNDDFPAKAESRSEYATIFLNSFMKQSEFFRINSLFGLIDFGSEVKVQQTITQAFHKYCQPNELINDTKTELSEAINEAINQIQRVIDSQNATTKFPNSRFRIILLTDDSGSSPQLSTDIINTLIQKQIIVDSIFLGQSSKIGKTISKLTGGLSVLIKDEDDITRIIEHEAFMNIKVRRINPLPYQNIDDSILKKELSEHAYNEIQGIIDTIAPNQMKTIAETQIKLTLPEIMAAQSIRFATHPIRIKRAFIELDIIAQNPSNSYKVYPSFATPEKWRIIIKGPDKTPFANHWLSLFLTLPQNYPFQPPDIRFVTIPFHPNVSSDGKLLFSAIDAQYSSNDGINYIIEQIIQCLKNPDRKYVIRQAALKCFIEDTNKYNRINANVGINPNQYQEQIYREQSATHGIRREQFRTQIRSIISKQIRMILKQESPNPSFMLNRSDFSEEGTIYENHTNQTKVIEVRDRQRNIKYAAKIYPNNSSIDVSSEVEIMSSILKHFAFVKMYGYYYTEDYSKAVIMDYIPQTLDNFILEKKSIIDCTKKLIIAYGIASGMAYLKLNKFSHGDLKVGNILINSDGYPKICDFDSLIKDKSVLLSPGFITYTRSSAPPEFNGDFTTIDCEKYDVFAFGLILYELITLRSPFYDENAQQLYSEVDFSNMIKEGKRPPIPDDINQEYRSLIQNCWDQDPNKRPTFQQIIGQLKELSDSVEIDQQEFKRYRSYLGVETYLPSQIKSTSSQQSSKKNSNMKRQLSHFHNYTQLWDQDVNAGYSSFGSWIHIYPNPNNANQVALEYQITLTDKVWNEILMEINILKRLSHPTLLKYIGFNIHGFNGSNKLVILTEKPVFTKTLHMLLEESNFYSPKMNTKKQCLIYGLAKSMEYLHSNGIIHGNLRPSTVLVDENYHPIIIGYGLQRTIDNKLHNADDEAEISQYRPPEIWQNPNAFSKGSDVYSFAILVYHIIGFKDNGFWTQNININVCNNRRPSLSLFHYYWWTRILQYRATSPFRELIQKCWGTNPTERNPFSKIVKLLEKKCILPGISQTEYQEYQATFNQNQSNS